MAEIEMSTPKGKKPPENGEPSSSISGQQDEPPGKKIRRISDVFPLLHLSQALKWWHAQVAGKIPPFADPRDYAALERTYLSYIRTSNHLASSGVVLGQLFILKAGRRTLGKVISSVMIVCAILICLLGAVRFYGQQHALGDKAAYDGGKGRGRAITSTGYVLVVFGMFVFVCTGLFVVILVIS